MSFNCPLLTDFLMFGNLVQDYIGPHAIDGTTESIVLSVPIVYVLKEQTNLFVSNL